MSVLLPAGLPAGFTVEPATGAHVAEAFAAYRGRADGGVRVLPRHRGGRALDAGAAGHRGELPSTWSVTRDGSRCSGGWCCVTPATRSPTPGSPPTRASRTRSPTSSREPAGRCCSTGCGPTRRRASTATSRCTPGAPPAAHPARGTSPQPGSPASAPSGRCSARSPMTPDRARGARTGHRGEPGRGRHPWRAERGVRRTLRVHADEPGGLAGGREDAWPGSTRTLRYLATIDGEPAAAMLLSRRARDRGGDVRGRARHPRAVPASRGRLGAACAGFEVAAREGLGQLALHVDSENAHAAPSVYRRAGLEVRTAFWAYARTVSR